MPKIDSLSFISNNKTIPLKVKHTDIDHTKMFTTDSMKDNVDEIILSNQNNNDLVDKDTNNEKKWLTHLGISCGAIAIAILGIGIAKKCPNLFKNNLFKELESGRIENTSEGVEAFLNSYKENGKNLYDILLKKGKNEASLRYCRIDKLPKTIKILFKDIIVPSEYIGKKTLYLPSLHSTGSGLGTEAIKESVKLSKKLGMNGRVTLIADTIDLNKGNPIPFYYKMGFKAFSSSTQKNIEQGMVDFYKNGQYTGPQRAMMYLPTEIIEKILSHCTL